MPTNKHASFRYRVLNQCFTQRGRQRWTLDELIDTVSDALHEAFGSDLQVSRRTVQGDINVMRSERPRGFAAPIRCLDGYYYYDDPDFSIEKTPLRESEVHTLREAFALLRQFGGLPQLDALQLLLQKMEGREHSVGLLRSIVHFETNPDTRGLHWLEPLYRAAEGKQPVRVAYQPFTADQPVFYIIHPYLLKEYRNRWFLFGLHEELQKISTLALDRIHHVERTTLPYRPNTLFDPETWFADIIGVSRPEGIERQVIELEAAPGLWPYLETKPLHRSQHVVQQNADGGVKFCVEVIPNYELMAELLRFGRDLRVLAPEAVRTAWLEQRG